MTYLPFGRTFGTIDECIVIKRPVEHVFSFYDDFRNLPNFLGDVVRIQVLGDFTSRWTVQAPLGLALNWTVIVTDNQPNSRVAYRTVSMAASVCWDVTFSPGPQADTTLVREVMSMPGGLIGRAVLGAIGKPPAKELRANLKRLKEFLETGHVSTMDYAITGKFSP